MCAVPRSTQLFLLLQPYFNENHPILPYFVPFRAMTNRDFGNLIVAGKTMAQSFLANSGRLTSHDYTIELAQLGVL